MTVSGLTGVSAIAARGDGATGYALRSDGTAWAWGFNHDGELGNNSTINSAVPVPVSTTTGLTGVNAIAGGGRSGYALRSDGTVWAWGDNLYGQLGNNNTPTDSLVPVQVNGA
ncbi:RCC1 domain-containing protein, alpha-tubulin suppressor [Candidatus Protofrankia californiensis]|uniref:RCC1 domain-containing protein, alpha-tubulin suppressor n=1 Tax=Candidatus Protofrankia californiensis TaxID=1839754 RepID=A0A1C3NYC5_9ACTN|nr:RCC1 domain-containing protein, alpha-tubulin suppressor [Candidatus Protofrankia californiensis]